MKWAGKMFVRGWIGRVLGAFLLTTSVLAVLMPWWVPLSILRLEPSGIKHDVGFAYTASLPFRVRFPFIIEADGSDSSRSSLELTESGAALSPAHISHDEIRALGEGRFSHWGGFLWFSASDNSDPRANARIYEVRARPTIAPSAFYALVALDAAFLLLWRRRIAKLLIPRIGGVVGSAAVLTMLAAILLAAGAFGTIREQQYGSPQDSALILDVIRHALIGLGLTIGQWTMGAGIARLLLGRQPPYASVVLLGFPISLAMTAVLVAIALCVRFGGWIAVGIWVASLIPLRRWAVRPSDLKSLLAAAPTLSVVAMGFGCWTALHWHGPTATLSGEPAGDLTYYASSIWTLAAHPIGWPNLGNEGETFSYFNQLLTGVGAALLHTFAIDGFLFMTASVATMGILGMGLAVHAYMTQKPRLQSHSAAAVTFLLALAGAGYYPSWLVASPPVIHTVPLSVAVWFWTTKSATEPRPPITAFASAFAGSMLSKVAGFATLGPVALAGAVPGFGRIPVFTKVVFGVLLGLAGFAVALTIAAFLPFYLSIATPVPESLQWLIQYQRPLISVWPIAARDLGSLLLIGLAFRIASLPTALALSAGLLVAIAFPFLLRINLVGAVIILALIGTDDPAQFEKLRWHALAAFGLLVPAMILTDPAGLATGVVWAVVIAGVWLLFVPAAKNDAAGCTVRAMRLWLGPVAAVVLGAVLIATARGTLILDTGSTRMPELTPSVRDIWAAVRERTPQDALVFTDQTGREPTLLGAWNTYAFHGQRQIYLANIYQSRELRADADRREERLKRNDDVLSGRLAPTQIATRHSYGSFYAVVREGRVMLQSWRPVYKNQRYTLYRWEPPHS